MLATILTVEYSNKKKKHILSSIEGGAQDEVVTRCEVGPVRKEDEIKHKKKKYRKNRTKSEQSERVLW